jgi:hypothetical protein
MDITLFMTIIDEEASREEREIPELRDRNGKGLEQQESLPRPSAHLS